jgi:PAS domain S-box-containing protein
MFLELLQDLAILLAFSMAYTLLFRSRARRPPTRQQVFGGQVGGRAVFAMLTPVALFPGVIIDSRSIFISMAGLMGGGLTALIAALPALVFRALSGGIGAPVGYAIIVNSALLGTAFHFIRRNARTPVSKKKLYLFGLIVQINMMLLMLLLPEEVRWQVLSGIALPVLLMYPVGTVLIGRLLMIQDEHSAAEQALRHSEARLAGILRSAPAGIGVLKDRMLVEVNRRVCEISGYRREELIGQSAKMLYPTQQEFLRVGSETYEQIRKNGTGSMETQWRRKDGAVRDILLSSTPLNPDEPDEGVIYTALEITERKQAENALWQSEERYRQLVEGQTDLLVRVDRDGRFLFVSPSYCKMFNKTEDELLGRTFLPLVHEDDRASTEQALKTLFVPPYEAYMEQRAKTKDGWRWLAWKDSAVVDEDGNIVSILGLGRDITEQKKAEEALAQSEEKFRNLVESSSDWIWEVDADGKYTYCSPQVEKILGYTPQEIIGKTPADLMPPPEAERVRKQFHALCTAAKPFVALENINLHKDGRPVILETSAVPVLSPEGLFLGYRGVDRDITKRKQSEDALKESTQKLALHIEQTPLGVVGWDTEFHVTEWNPAAEEIFGYTREEALGRHASFIIPDAVHEQTDQVLQHLMENTGGTRSANENITRSGERIACEWYNTPLIDDDGRVIGAASLVMDVTARKKAEEERERLMLAIEQSAEIVLITDADARILYVNPAFERITGFSREEVLGQNPKILQSGRHTPAFYRKMWNTLSAGKPWSGQLANRKKDGSLYTEEATISPVTDGSGKVVNYVGVKRDVTREIELEDQLRQAQKMEAVGQMAGGIAHDFNNLLQVICGYVELAQMDMDAEHPLAPAIGEIAIAAQRGKGLINQLLAFSRRQVINPVDLDLNQLIDAIRNMLRKLIGEHIEFKVIAGRGLGTIHVDSGLIEQVLMNLCANARDAMPDGGTLTIETKNVAVDADYARANDWASPGRYVLLSVTDTGCGMDARTLEHIFEPFFSTKEVGKGTGLGLSTVFGIIQQHHGHINSCSEVGQGTSFEIFLPAVDRQAAEVSRTDPGPVAGGTETILVAEDDETVLKLAEHLLTHAGYRVLTARDGREALAMFKKHSRDIDVAMLDVVMPHMGGKQTLDQILALRPGLPHLFASGYSENELHTNFIQDRELHLLNKPYQAETLLRKIREVLDAQ